MSHPSLSPTPLFTLGRILITPGAEAILTPPEVSRALHRHQHGDYGALEPDDVHQNNRGLSNCGMVMSVYRAADGTEFWIKTHGTRSHTLIMLPGE
jgi:hypothetical protein